ncbi:MAG: hypothetical protein OEY14_06990 [Myxococcales bacterium]|nr:hypothetical protein [Myxococcales bacterium]
MAERDGGARGGESSLAPEELERIVDGIALVLALRALSFIAGVDPDAIVDEWIAGLSESPPS